jgi:hypothetical protein
MAPGPKTRTSEHPDSYDGEPGRVRVPKTETKVINPSDRKDGPRGPNRAPDSYSE